jgi:hypothetical protein
MSRISRGAFELRKERVEVATVVRNAIETSHPLIQASGHQLIMSLPDSALSEGSTREAPTHGAAVGQQG